jgi:hypothetical protein
VSCHEGGPLSLNSVDFGMLLRSDKARSSPPKTSCRQSFSQFSKSSTGSARRRTASAGRRKHTSAGGVGVHQDEVWRKFAGSQPGHTHSTGGDALESSLKGANIRVKLGQKSEQEENGCSADHGKTRLYQMPTSGRTGHELCFRLGLIFLLNYVAPKAQLKIP